MRTNEFFRISALCILWTIALVLLLCENDNVNALLVAKGLGFGLVLLAWRVGGYWLDRGLLPWTREITREE